MTKKAEKFKNENKLDYDSLSMKDLNELPLYRELSIFF